MTIAAISSPFQVTASRSSFAGSSNARRAPRASQRHLHLTRRGRLVLIGLPLMLLAAAVLTFVGMFTTPVFAGTDAPSTVEAVKVTVMEGDSMWSIAKSVSPNQDPRTTIEQIQELNSIDGKHLKAGQEIFVPVHP
ncbi:LysM peptidoglycan-binding domain-containing protein [Neomicrococcus lactis]|uniref:LysM domain-containing protein n=1 Tax=Neomicrococcus lactis TaxID=732241 RepID=A0A7W8YAM3_9MICC|nr:LysM peptidoglycan-binding domain-containing protein [Neomicrococcus lactis]MBB5598014.1 hypothetical protein [Neomicrococcus lactis]